PHPVFNLYNSEWPIYTAASTNPPAKVVHDGRAGPAEIADSILSNGVIVSGATVRGSVLSPEVRIGPGAVVEGAVLCDRVTVGPGAVVRRAIVDKNVEIPPGARIGIDPDEDRKRFETSAGGVVAIPKNYRFT